jgi:acetoin utilization deacetylase AcuC-like enzyme
MSDSTIIHTKRQTGYVWDELFNFHHAGDATFEFSTEPGVQHWENADSKRRCYSLLMATGLGSKLTHINARHATLDEVKLVHSEEYLEKIKRLSEEQGLHEAGECARFGLGGYEVALRSVGGVLAACQAVTTGIVNNAYALVRPPGHHAERDQGRGFCIFNNIAIAARYIQETTPHKRIAIVDYDVHHGNGTQDMFYEDDTVLFISIHQDSNYPANSGAFTETGKGNGEGYTINIPLPPGSSKGAYRTAFKYIVEPALREFRPDFILVSSGFDGSFLDPLAAMGLSSLDFGYMADSIVRMSEYLCDGRCVFCHEGGYSKDYVPYCFLDVMTALKFEGSELQALQRSSRALPKDPYLPEIECWRGRDLQRHQWLVINAVLAIHSVLPKSPLRGAGRPPSPPRDPLEAYVMFPYSP